MLSLILRCCLAMLVIALSTVACTSNSQKKQSPPPKQTAYSPEEAEARSLAKAVLEYLTDPARKHGEGSKTFKKFAAMLQNVPANATVPILAGSAGKMVPLEYQPETRTLIEKSKLQQDPILYISLRPPDDQTISCSIKKSGQRIDLSATRSASGWGINGTKAIWFVE